MAKIHSPQEIRTLEKKFNFHMAKKLGQNFLTDGNVIVDIVESSGATEEDLVIEIGPGMGILTAQAAEVAGKVVAIEIDKKLLPILEETLKQYDNIKIINEDVLKVNLTQTIEQERQLKDGRRAQNVRILGNLPYYITTPILMKLLEDRLAVETITIMVQKEVAQRIAAAPGSRTYGAISVAVQYYCEVEYVQTVPKEVFVPRPKVDSAILLLKVRKNSPVDLISEEIFFECIKKGFGQRRKTLKNSLADIQGKNKEEIGIILTECGIDPIRRAETLSISEFAALANRLASPGLHISFFKEENK
ncbi:MAG: 16S rRNA (adenine(1518)-N(6)/adenine(1519)-N(6))-dimethyltransferase RsmA [Clostridia bacterium]|nr:16S rRNA (adenine(1518)-N(6)/adenine(1519)-N(6))-dimethyltransferase RsmA [Clostridia bacterium]